MRTLWDHPTLSYVGSITLITLVLLASIFLFATGANGTQAQILTAILLAILPASAIAIQLVNWLVVLIIPPHTLPKLELKNGIPPEYRTMVVIPALLGTEKDVTFLTRQIENHFVGNQDLNVLFALLTDFADAPEKIMPQDEELLNQTITRIKELNENYGTPEYQPFFLFNRERIWNLARRAGSAGRGSAASWRSSMSFFGEAAQQHIQHRSGIFNIWARSIMSLRLMRTHCYRARVHAD